MVRIACAEVWLVANVTHVVCVCLQAVAWLLGRKLFATKFVLSAKWREFSKSFGKVVLLCNFVAVYEFIFSLKRDSKSCLTLHLMFQLTRVLYYYYYYYYYEICIAHKFIHARVGGVGSVALVV